MVKVKTTLLNKKNKEGQLPIYLRITANRKSAYLFTGFYVHEAHWNNGQVKELKALPLAKRMNNDIAKQKVELEEFIIDKGISKGNHTGPQIKELFLKEKNKDANAQAGKPTLFFAFAKERLKQLKAQGKFNHYGTLKSQLNVLSEYVDPNITFEAIDQEYLENLRVWLKKDKNGKVRSTRTVTDYLIAIKSPLQ